MRVPTRFALVCLLLIVIVLSLPIAQIGLAHAAGIPNAAGTPGAGIKSAGSQNASTPGAVRAATPAPSVRRVQLASTPIPAAFDAGAKGITAEPTATPAPPNPIEWVLKGLIQATIYFPAKLIKDAIKKAANGILSEELTQTRVAVQAVLGINFINPGAHPADASLGPTRIIVDPPGAINTGDVIHDIGDVMTAAAVPLWALGLALIGLTAVMRNVAGLDFTLGDTGYAFIRWVIICLLSGNGIALAMLLHGMFDALALGIFSSTPFDAGKLSTFLVPSYLLGPNASVVLQLIVAFIALVIVVIMALALLARWVITLALVAMAPLAIATEGVPYLRFVCRDWLSSFLRVELLNILNAIVLTLFFRLVVFASSDAKTIIEAIKAIVFAVGLISVITSLNYNVYRYVFGAVADIVGQMTGAVAAIVGTIAAVASGGAAGLATAGAASSLVGNATGSSLLRGFGQGVAAGTSQSNGRKADEHRKATLANQAEANALRREANQHAAEGNAQRRATGEQVRASQTRQAEQQAALGQRDDERRHDAIARSTGARTPTDIDSVKSAIGTLSGLAGKESAERAFKDVAPVAQAIAAEQRGQLGAAAATLGKASWGEVVGSLAEEKLRGSDLRVSDSRVGGKLASTAPQFGEPLVASAVSSVMAPVSAEAGSSSTASAPTPSQAPSSRMATEALMQSVGAQTKAERASVGSAINQLRHAYPSHTADAAVRQVASEMRGYAESAGGLTQAAKTLGYANPGAMFGASANRELQSQGQSPNRSQSFDPPPTPARIAQLPGYADFAQMSPQATGVAAQQRGELLSSIAPTPADRRQFDTTMAQLQSTYGAGPTQQALQNVSPAFTAMTQAAGGPAPVVARLQAGGWQGNSAVGAFGSLVEQQMQGGAGGTPQITPPVTPTQLQQTAPSLPLQSGSPEAVAAFSQQLRDVQMPHAGGAAAFVGTHTSPTSAPNNPTASQPANLSPVMSAPVATNNPAPVDLGLGQMALPPGYGYQSVLGRYHEHALGPSQAEGVHAPQQGRNMQAMSPFDQLIGHQIASNLHVSPGIGAERYAQLVQQFRQVPSGLAQGGYVSQLIAQSDRIGREHPVGSAALARFDGYLTQLVQKDPLLEGIELRPHLQLQRQQSQESQAQPTSTASTAKRRSFN